MDVTYTDQSNAYFTKLKKKLIRQVRVVLLLLICNILFPQTHLKALFLNIKYFSQYLFKMIKANLFASAALYHPNKTKQIIHYVF